MKDNLTRAFLVLLYLLAILPGPKGPPSQGAQLAFDFRTGTQPPAIHKRLSRANYPTYPRGGWRKDASGVSPNARRLTKAALKAYSGYETPYPKPVRGSGDHPARWSKTPCGRTTHVRAWSDLH